MRNTKFDLNSKYLIPLAMLYSVFCLSADVVAFRFTGIGPIVESGATLLFPLTYLISDIITEVYGYHIAKKLIWLILLGELLFAILLRLVNITPPASFSHNIDAYNTVVNPIFGFVIAGIIANLSSDFLNIYIISKWKILTNGRLFWLRSIASTAISEFILVVISIVLGFGRTLDTKDLITVLVSAYGLELFYAFIFVWPALAIVTFLKKSEHIDVFDTNINYNPFSLA